MKLFFPEIYDTYRQAPACRRGGGLSAETLEKLGRQYQMGIFPNIVREYFQHIFTVGI